MKIKTSLPRFGRAAVCVTLAAALACGCSAPSVLGFGEGGAQSQTEAEAKPYDTSRLDDGKLRMLYSYSFTLGSAVLRGSEVLCESSPTDMLSLVTESFSGESHYYLHSWNDASSPSGRRCVLYDELGAEVLSFDSEVRVWLTGNYLVVYNNSVSGDYDLNEPNSVRVFDLSTTSDGSIVGEVAVPENTVECTPIQNCLIFTTYAMPEGVADIYDDDERYAHCSVQIQDENGTVVFEDTGCDATSVYMSGGSSLPSWVNIRYYSGADFEAYRSMLYRPADGKQLNNFVQTSGSGTACFLTADGKYELRDLSGAATAVLGEFDGKWVSDYIPNIAILTGSDYNYTLRSLATGEETALRSFCYTDDMLVTFAEDGTLTGYDRTSGEKVFAAPVSFSTEAENGYSLYSLTGEYIWLQKFGGANTQSEIQIFSRDGFVADVTPLTERYTYISDLAATEDGLLLYGGYEGPGKTSLYDVVDCSGNVLQSGLSLCYTDNSCELPDGCFLARRGYYYGWMDTEGNWLYCQNVFSSLSSDDTVYLY